MNPYTAFVTCPTTSRGRSAARRRRGTRVNGRRGAAACSRPRCYVPARRLSHRLLRCIGASHSHASTPHSAGVKWAPSIGRGSRPSTFSGHGGPPGQTLSARSTTVTSSGVAAGELQQLLVHAVEGDSLALELVVGEVGEDARAAGGAWVAIRRAHRCACSRCSVRSIRAGASPLPGGRAGLERPVAVLRGRRAPRCSTQSTTSGRSRFSAASTAPWPAAGHVSVPGGTRAASPVTTSPLAAPHPTTAPCAVFQPAAPPTTLVPTQRLHATESPTSTTCRPSSFGTSTAPPDLLQRRARPWRPGRACGQGNGCWSPRLNSGRSLRRAGGRDQQRGGDEHDAGRCDPPAARACEDRGSGRAGSAARRGSTTRSRTRR